MVDRRHGPHRIARIAAQKWATERAKFRDSRTIWPRVGLPMATVPGPRPEPRLGLDRPSRAGVHGHGRPGATPRPTPPCSLLRLRLTSHLCRCAAPLGCVPRPTRGRRTPHSPATPECLARARFELLSLGLRGRYKSHRHCGSSHSSRPGRRGERLRVGVPRRHPPGRDPLRPTRRGHRAPRLAGKKLSEDFNLARGAFPAAPSRGDHPGRSRTPSRTRLARPGPLIVRHGLRGGAGRAGTG